MEIYLQLVTIASSYASGLGRLADRADGQTQMTPDHPMPKAKVPRYLAGGKTMGNA